MLPLFRHLRGDLLLQRSRHQAYPTDRASLRLLHGARRRGGEKVRARLCLWQLGGECLPSLNQAPANICPHMSATEPPSSRSDGLSKLAAASWCEATAESRCVINRLCLWQLDGECLPSLTQAPARRFAFATEPPSSSSDWSSIEACGCSTVRGGEAESRCMLVFASGTCEEICLCNGAAIKLVRLMKQACGCSTV